MHHLPTIQVSRSWLSYGQPPRKAPLVQWEEVAVDLIGPWQITINGQEIDALTCIDPVVNLTKLVRITNKSSAHVAMRFKNEWLMIKVPN
jgi:hypothetical protein